MLNENVVRYHKAPGTRLEAEEKKIFILNTWATLSGNHPIEKVAGELYTQRVFKKFEVEFIANNNCMQEL